MPYKDPQKQRAAQASSYQRHKARIQERQRDRRREPGYRDSEFAKRLDLTLEEYRRRKAAGTLRPGPTPKPQKPKPQKPPRPRAEKPPVVRKSAARRRQESLDLETQRLLEHQRDLKAAALRRLGLLPQ